MSSTTTSNNNSFEAVQLNTSTEPTFASTPHQASQYPTAANSQDEGVVSVARTAEVTVRKRRFRGGDTATDKEAFDSSLLEEESTGHGAALPCTKSISLEERLEERHSSDEFYDEDDDLIPVDVTADEEEEKFFDISRAKGMILMVISAFLSSIVYILIKYQSTSTVIGSIQAVIFRNFFLAAGCHAHLKYDKQTILDIPKGLSKFIFLRCLFGFIQTVCHYGSYDFLPLSIAVIVVKTQPIFVMLNCYIFLKEKLSKVEILSVIVSLFGVMFIVCPDVFLGEAYKVKKFIKAGNDHQRSSADFYFGIVLALTAAFVGSFIYVFCRKIREDVHPAMHQYYNGIMVGVGGTWILFAQGFSIGHVTPQDCVLLTICGLLSWVQSEIQSYAFFLDKGGRLASIDYLVVVNTFLADMFLFKEEIQLTNLLGALCVMISVLLNAVMRCFGKTK